MPVFTVWTESGSFFSIYDIGSGFIQSGLIASGQIGRFHIASGELTGDSLGSGSIVSGLIASGQIGRFHIASGRLAGFELGSGAIVSGRVASGQIGFGHLANGSVQSGTLASGQISSFHIASGSLINHSQEVVPFYPTAQAGIWNITCEEPISGVRAVCVSQSGNLLIAMAAISGRMPAIGIVEENRISGAACRVYTIGTYQFTSGMADYSGFIGKRIWVGQSGQIVTLSGAWGSGGYLSGDLGQCVGVVWNSGGATFNVWPHMWSGGPLGASPAMAF